MPSAGQDEGCASARATAQRASALGSPIFAALGRAPLASGRDKAHKPPGSALSKAKPAVRLDARALRHCIHPSHLISPQTSPSGLPLACSMNAGTVRSLA